MFSFLAEEWKSVRVHVSTHIMPRSNEFTRFVFISSYAFEIALILFCYMKFTLKL